MKVIAVANHKGGVGKTTVALNLAVGLALAGRSVLALDLDPQGHLGLGLGGRLQDDPGQSGRSGVDWLLRADPDGPAAPLFYPGGVDGLVYLPAGPDLDRTEAELAGLFDNVLRLARWLQKFDFDAVIIDTRPTLGILTSSALAAADLVIAPVTPGRYPLEGLADLLAAAQLQTGEDGLRVLINMLDTRNAATNRWLEEELEPVRDLLLRTRIRRSEPVNQSAIGQESVLAFAPRSIGAADFRALTREVLLRWI